MKTLEDVQAEVANEFGWTNWWADIPTAEMWLRVCHRAQEEALKNAAERVDEWFELGSNSVYKRLINESSNIVK